jgi:hypothetical protein
VTRLMQRGDWFDLIWFKASIQIKSNLFQSQIKIKPNQGIQRLNKLQKVAGRLLVNVVAKKEIDAWS